MCDRLLGITMGYLMRNKNKEFILSNSESNKLHTFEQKSHVLDAPFKLFTKNLTIGEISLTKEV